MIFWIFIAFLLGVCMAFSAIEDLKSEDELEEWEEI